MFSTCFNIYLHLGDFASLFSVLLMFFEIKIKQLIVLLSIIRIHFAITVIGQTFFGLKCELLKEHNENFEIL